MSDVTFRYNGLAGWSRPILKNCTTCGKAFETAQRTKKYCSSSCHPKRRKRKTDDFVTQITVLECVKCGEKTIERLLVTESLQKSLSEHICTECLHSLPVIAIFGESS